MAHRNWRGWGLKIRLERRPRVHGLFTSNPKFCHQPWSAQRGKEWEVRSVNGCWPRMMRTVWQRLGSHGFLKVVQGRPQAHTASSIGISGIEISMTAEWQIPACAPGKSLPSMSQRDPSYHMLVRHTKTLEGFLAAERTYSLLMLLQAWGFFFFSFLPDVPRDFITGEAWGQG